MSDAPAPPPWSSGNEIDAAVRALAVASRRAGPAAYRRVLCSVGNEHARTYWPAALSLVPRLEVLLSADEDPARVRALEVLVDLCACFSPAPGFEIVETATGPRHLARLLHAALTGLERTIQRIEDSTSSPREQRLASELLSYIATPPQAASAVS